ncbi:MAG: DUF4783 domain-containing protein [Bacteroidetes bacterium]|nr:DUF4783 domain-containing protein [Bacteroidota bacterium]
MKIIKNTPLLMLMFIGFFPISLSNMSNDELISNISKAIQKGSAPEVASYFSSNVELLLPGNDGTFSKTQAEVILRNFFNENPPASFSINHQGSSRDGSKYAIGTYKTKSGDSYRVYYLVKKVGDSFLLHQLQFEKQ